MTSQAALACVHVSKHFDMAGTQVPVLQDVHFAIDPHASCAIMGASGCGKSTLLHILGGLEQPSSGEVFIAGQAMTGDSESIARLRNRHLGFVYQFHHLLADLTALENVAMPLLIAGMPRADALASSTDWLQRVGLAQQAKKKPAYLSGGERQRVAIARALIHAPSCVLADEPTANLDASNARVVLDLLLTLCQDHGSSLVLVTHDATIARSLQRQVRLVQGRLQG